MNLRHPALFLALGLLGALPTFASDPQCEVNVNVAMTDVGRKVEPPTQAKPAYYFPVVAGYREEGAKVAGEKQPPVKSVVHLLAKTLAQQHYFVISKEHPQPNVLLVFHWGYMNPEIDDMGDVDNPQKVFYNQNEMLSLVGGQTLGMLDLDFEKEAVMQGAEDDRYFVIVSAYDFAAARQHKKVLLWQARMSTPSGGVTLDEVLPSLIASGGPMFGRETIRPKWIDMPIAREGHVEIGTPEFKNYIDAPANPPPAAAPAKK